MRCRAHHLSASGPTYSFFSGLNSAPSWGSLCSLRRGRARAHTHERVVREQLPFKAKEEVHLAPSRVHAFWLRLVASVFRRSCMVWDQRGAIAIERDGRIFRCKKGHLNLDSAGLLPQLLSLPRRSHRRRSLLSPTKAG